MKAVCSSEILVPAHKNTDRNNTEDKNIIIHHIAKYIFFLPRCSHTWELAAAFGA
jgi:hypothetical protein